MEGKIPANCIKCLDLFRYRDVVARKARNKLRSMARAYILLLQIAKKVGLEGVSIFVDEANSKRYRWVWLGSVTQLKRDGTDYN